MGAHRYGPARRLESERASACARSHPDLITTNDYSREDHSLRAMIARDYAAAVPRALFGQSGHQACRGLSRTFLLFGRSHVTAISASSSSNRRKCVDGIIICPGIISRIFAAPQLSRGSSLSLSLSLSCFFVLRLRRDDRDNCAIMNKTFFQTSEFHWFVNVSFTDSSIFVSFDIRVLERATSLHSAAIFIDGRYTSVRPPLSCHRQRRETAFYFRRSSEHHNGQRSKTAGRTTCTGPL